MGKQDQDAELGGDSLRALLSVPDPDTTVIADRRKYDKGRPPVQYGDKRTKGREKAFLDVLSQAGSIAAACEAAGIGRTTAFRWRDENEEFANAWTTAIEVGNDLLEEEAVRRAVDGVDEPVFYQGIKVGHVRKYSDKLLEIMLRARRRSVFGDKLALTGANGGPMAVTMITRRVIDPKDIGNDSGE